MPPVCEPEAFPIVRVDQVAEKPKETQWLVEPLWAAQAVGVLGGASRSFKTWLATELALAVAAGVPALGRFPARAAGPVLFFGAEDDPGDLRARFEGIATARAVPFVGLPVYFLDVATLRLDRGEQVQRLRKTVQALRPLLLVLDPFVRLVAGDFDENSASDVSAVLGALRAVQRDLGCGVLLVHHTRKSPSAHPGHQLRGSGDFAAWSASALFLTRKDDNELVLSVEHRNAPAPPPVCVRLVPEPQPHLVVEDYPAAAPLPPCEPAPSSAEAADPFVAAVLARLAAGRAYTTRELRDVLKVRKSTLLATLNALRARGLVTRSTTGWRRSPGP